MSLDQAKAFAEGLKELSADFRADAKTTTEDYVASLEGASKEITDASHTYAQDMVTRADQYLDDIKALYKEIYPKGGDE